MLASEETLTETSPDSLVFSNEDSSFTIKLNNYKGTLPDNLDITINNTDYLEISKAELILPKVNPSAYVYTNESMDGGSDLPPNNPLDEGQGVFRIRVDGLSSGYLGVPPEALQDLKAMISGGISTQTPPLTLQQDGSYMTDKLVLLPEGIPATYDGVINLYAINSIDKWSAIFSDGIESKDNDKPKGAFVGTYGTLGLGDTIKDIAKILHENLGYTTNKPDFTLTRQDVIDAVPNYSIWYSLTHGTVNTKKDKVFKAIAVAPDFYYTVDEDGIHWHLSEEIYPNDIAAHIGDNSYKFVFLNGCFTADDKNGSAAAAFMSYYKATEYLGWKVSIMQGAATEYANRFYEWMSRKDEDAGNPVTVGYAYDKLKNIKFGNYNGSDARYLGNGTIDIHLEKN